MKEHRNLKVQFRDRLIEWSETGLEVRFSDLNSFQRSRQMVKFFVSEILEKLYPGIVPDDEGELESCIVDGSGDGGVDFLYRTDEGQVLVLQAKYRGKEAQESPEAVGRICDFLDRLYLATQGKQHGLRPDLIELANQIDWAEDTFRVYFITTAKSNQAVLDRVEQGLTQIAAFPDLAEERSEFRYLDQSGLNQELREAISSADFANRPIEIPMIPDAEGRAWCHYEGESRELFVGEVGGGVLANILQNHKASLFTMNIRDYVGDTKTNQRIVSTALDDPQNFEYFNNGVTAVAGKITPEPLNNQLVCEKMSIINGAQTIRCLLAATKKASKTQHKPLGSVRVLFRLISFKYPKEIDLVGEITRYNNTQNAVKIADFRSNDEVQKDLARRFSKLNLSGRSYEYKNKRSGKKRNTLSITLEDLTKAIFAFRFGPDDIFGGTSKLFDTTTNGLYRQVFSTPENTLTDSEFSIIAGTYFACDFVKELWEQFRRRLRNEKQAMHPALERKNLVFFAVGELLRQTYAKEEWDLAHDLSRLAKPNAWRADMSSSPRTALSKAFEIASMVLRQRYETKRTSSPGFKHRNWFRDENTLNEVRAGLELALAFGVPPKLMLP